MRRRSLCFHQESQLRSNWRSTETKRRYFDWIAKKLGITTQTEWYKVTKQDITARGGSSLLSRQYGNSVYRALIHVYPEYEWHPWLFDAVPVGYWNKHENIRKYADWLAETLNIEFSYDWYEVASSVIKGHAGNGILYHFRDSPIFFLQTAYPEFEWERTETVKVISGYWDNENHQRKFVEKIGKKMGINTFEDWYNVNSAEFRRHGGNRVLKMHGGMSKMMSTLFPEHPWQLWRFEKVSSGYWSSKSNRRKFFEDIAESLGVKKMDDWYGIQLKTIYKKGGYSLLRQYNFSLHKAMLDLFPEHPWQRWMWNNVPPKSWRQNPDDQREFFEWVMRDLNLKNLEDWYQVSLSDIRSRGGTGLLNVYNGSLCNALKKIFPEFEWKLWFFTLQAYKSWTQQDKREYMDWVGEQLGVKHLEDWYQVRFTDVMKLPCSGIWKSLYNSSLIEGLLSVYPEHDWHVWKFARLPTEFWDSNQNQQTFLKWIEKVLEIKHPDDWKRITLDRLYRYKGIVPFLKENHGLMNVLLKFYPTVDWSDITGVCAKNQRALLNIVTQWVNENLDKNVVVKMNESRVTSGTM